jgi:hypothetical protein
MNLKSRPPRLARFVPAALMALSLSLSVLSSSGTASADPPAQAAAWTHTGDAVRTKSVGPFTAKVYSIRHDIKGDKPAKAKQAVIEADIEKKFTWRMLRDVESTKIQKALTEALQMNGFGDGGRIAQFVGAFSAEEIKENYSVIIFYNPGPKTTTISVQGGKVVTIPGADFMKAVWSIWLGKIDQPSMGDSLISKL